MTQRPLPAVDDAHCPRRAIGCPRVLSAATLGLLTLSLLGSGVQVMAGPFFQTGERADHFVLANKRLSEDWRQALYEKGTTRVYRGKELNLIGMPVGGIAAGQLYICGDGTLGEWKIFNQQYFSGYGRDNYRPRMPGKPIDQGFAVVAGAGDELTARRLSRQGFPDVEFVGEYPIANVRYADDGFPLRVELEAFSPFIPLNARDSAMPVTVLRYTLENISEQGLSGGLLGWLEKENPKALLEDGVAAEKKE